MVKETVTERRLSRLVTMRLGHDVGVRCTGDTYLPHTGSYVLAVNHCRSGPTLDVVAAVLMALERARPGIVDTMLLVSGRRIRGRLHRRFPPTRLVSLAVNYAFRRWERNATRIPLGNTTTSIRALRAWKSRAQRQPVLVFPEGKARVQFGALRPGAGRWLASLGRPTLPVGIWWQQNTWHVEIGAPLVWSHRRELHDVQLGLAMAALLPEEQAPFWEEPLARWRAAHAESEPQMQRTHHWLTERPRHVDEVEVVEGTNSLGAFFGQARPVARA
jgi:hypothetical protein